MKQHLTTVTPLVAVGIDRSVAEGGGSTPAPHASVIPV